MNSTENTSDKFGADAAAPGDRALAAWEIASVVSSALIAEWILAAAAGRSKLIVAIPLTLAFLLMLFSHRLHRETLRDLGFRFDNFLRAFRLLLLPMGAVAIISLIIGLLAGARPDFFRWHSERSLYIQLTLGFGWGFLQQYVLQAFINRRTQRIWEPGKLTILATAVIFAALHFPNPSLMSITFVGGVIWASVYQREPNLFALAVSHSVMTWVLVSTLPISALNHLRIGFKYFA